MTSSVHETNVPFEQLDDYNWPHGMRNVRTGRLEVGSLVGQRVVDGIGTAHLDALSAQHIAELLDLSRRFPEVPRWERLASVLLVKRPVLFVCVRLQCDGQKHNLTQVRKQSRTSNV